MEKIAEIKGAIRAFRSDSTWTKLRARWDSDFDLWRLKPYDPGSGYLSYTSNSPQVLISKGVSMLSSARLVIRIPEDTLQKDELETANNIERFHYGVLNMNDDNLARRPDMPSLRDQLAWYAVLRGTVVIRALVKKMHDGSTFPELAAWDIYNTCYGEGAEGLNWAAHVRVAPKAEIEEEYGITINKPQGEIIDFWDRKNNGVIVENQWGKKLTPHGLDYCPVFVLKAGPSPVAGHNTYTNTGLHAGESMLGSNRDLYPVLNKTISNLLTIVSRGTRPPLGYWSAGAQKTLDKDIWQVEDAFAVPMDSTANEKIEPLIDATMPNDAENMINFVLSDIQRGGISHIAMGELGFRLSGFAITQLQASLATIIVPFSQVIERAYTVGLMALQQQYAKGKWKAVEVRGRTSKNSPFGVPEPIKLKPSDIKEGWRPEISLTPTYPKDDAQRYQIAALATQSDKPILSMKTARSELVGVEDTALEAENVALESVGRLPIITLLEGFKAALAEKDMDKAMAIVGELERLMASRGQTTRTSQGQTGMTGFPPVQRMSMEETGMGTAEQETGLPSNVLPPEATLAAPSGATRAGEG